MIEILLVVGLGWLTLTYAPGGKKIVGVISAVSLVIVMALVAIGLFKWLGIIQTPIVLT